MALAMRYKGFTWPNNPRTYTLSAQRQTAVHKIPMGGFVVQDLGENCTVMKGEGEFFGPNAYRQFQALLQVFQEDGPGSLIHPVWQTSSAYFTQLSLSQEPREDYVAYSFTFCEGKEDAGGSGSWAAGTDSRKKIYQVQAGDSIWSLAEKFAVTVSSLLAMNSEIANPKDLTVGQKVRVQ